MTKKPKVMVGIAHSRSGWEPEMVQSTLGMVLWDAYHQRRVPIPTDEHPAGGVMFCAGTNIEMQRNDIVRAFIKSDCDWLLFLDTDEQWEPVLIERLLESADEDLRPIVSGLIMARRDENQPIAPACVVKDSQGRYNAPRMIPNVRWWNVAGVGAGCLFVHRKVYEAIQEKFGDREPSEWFEYTNWTYVDDDGVTQRKKMGEDYTFSLRAQECGFPCLVDTTIQLGHVKPVVLSTDTFYRQNAGMGYLPTYIVMPVKDRLDLTRNIVEQLRDQQGWDGFFIFDNGSNPETKKWLAEQTDVFVIDAKGLGIHEMWNAGINQCLMRSGGRCNIAFLNNDLILGHEFLTGLTDALRSGPWACVSPNYDKRPIKGTRQVNGICALHYYDRDLGRCGRPDCELDHDGGGIAGFAFMVRGEWLAQTGYRFPEACKWWYGDNDILLMMDRTQAPYGIVGNVAVEHIGAGTAKDWDDPKWKKQTDADAVAWQKSLAERGIEVVFG